jgi:hypothetical protein
MKEDILGFVKTLTFNCRLAYYDRPVTSTTARFIFRGLRRRNLTKRTLVVNYCRTFPVTHCSVRNDKKRHPPVIDAWSRWRVKLCDTDIASGDESSMFCQIEIYVCSPNTTDSQYLQRVLCSVVEKFLVGIARIRKIDQFVRMER